MKPRGLPGALRGARQLAVGAFVAFIEDEGDMIAGYLAFVGLLSFFPFLIFLTALAGYFVAESDIAAIVALALAYMPEEVVKTLAPELEAVLGRRRGGLLTIGAGVALWVASGGVEALRTALNRAYNLRETRPFWRRRIQSAFVVVVFGLAVPVAAALVVLWPVVLSILARFMDAQVVIAWDWAWTRYGLAAAIMFGVLLALHRWLPNTHVRIADAAPGALITTVVWLAAATGFSIYLRSIADYASTYGGLGGVVATLLFLYVTGAVFLYGAEMSGILSNRRQNPVDE